MGERKAQKERQIESKLKKKNNEKNITDLTFR